MLQEKKIAIFYIFEILKEYTDIDHPLTQAAIGQKLNIIYHIELERKSIAANLQILSEDLNCDINNDGKYVRIKPAEVSPYLISVFDTTTGKKTVYEAKEVATDVPFNPNELSDWRFWCDECGKNVPTEETEYF